MSGMDGVRPDQVEQLLIADRMAREARYRCAAGLGRLFGLDLSEAREILDGSERVEQVLAGVDRIRDRGRRGVSFGEGWDAGA